jgi:DNA modification methylase
VTDPRNRLNDLTNREWLLETKSFWFSSAPPRSPLKSTHPATFSERDIERLIRFFTKSGELVLDPFAGSGSTLLAARTCGRPSLGLELIPRWAEVARRRLEEESPPESAEIPAEVREGEALTELRQLPGDHAGFIVTSPPYWQILRKRPGMKAQAERVDRGLPTHYSEDPRDLGNLQSYPEFLTALGDIFAECGRVLQPNKYLAVVVSDFRNGPEFVLYHADLAREIEARGLPLKGLTVLLQDNKTLYPNGMFHGFVSNIHHQYILVFQKR